MFSLYLSNLLQAPMLLFEVLLIALNLATSYYSTPNMNFIISSIMHSYLYILLGILEIL